MKHPNILLKNIKQVKKAIQENKRLYTIYSDIDNQHIKIVSIQEITENMTNDSYINVTLETGVKCELRYWEISIHTKEEIERLNK